MTDTNTGQMVGDLTSTNNAVLGKGWVSSGLSGTGGPLSLLGSTADPLSGLAEAGLSWFTPLVSFLSDGLSQLQGGDAASVSSGSQDFNGAGQNIGDLANSYGNSTTAQTTSWTGKAASDYRGTAAQHATGVAGLGTASTTVGSSIIGAGQVVAQAISDITELIGEAVAQIVPIMTQAIARAQQTMGESVVEAIPPCVGIAVEYAMKIMAKLAALMASGQNLLKLVQGASGVVDLIQQALSSISQQSSQSGAQPSSSTNPSQATDPSSSSDPLSGLTTPDSSGGGTGSGDGSTSPSASDAGFNSGDLPTPDASAGQGDGSDSGTTPDPNGTTSPDLNSLTNPSAVPLDTTQSAAAFQPSTSAMPDTSQAAGVPMSTGAFQSGASALAIGARSGASAGAGTVRQRGRQQPAAASDDKPGTGPIGGMGGGMAAGDKDKKHQRKYDLIQKHDEDLEVAPAVITMSAMED
jgi:hypothetical protein